MNKYLHYCAPIIVAFSLGFAFGFGYRCREVKKLKNEKENLVDMLHSVDNSVNDISSLNETTCVQREV
jgi:hypothetical protein